MKASIDAFLQIEKGRVEGYEEQGRIPLSADALLIGRPSEKNAPDIKVRDDYVSRNHAEVTYNGGCFMLRDIDSANGTEINDERIEKDKFYPLKDGDLIGLAIVSGEPRVTLRFRQSEATLLSLTHPPNGRAAKGLIVDVEARRVFVDDMEIPLRRREFDLLAFLYRNKGKACSEDEIAEKVWADVGGIVSPQTIDQDIHRIRRGVEPDPSRPRYITTLPRYGYRLEL